MSRLQKDSTIPRVASTSQEGQENRTLKVTLLSNEWKSSTDGELSTINRELAIQLAKHPNVDVSVLLPSCSGEDRSSAKSHNVKLIEAQGVPGVEPVLWLSSPPRNHKMDCVIGHGVHLGRLITLIKRNLNYCHCKWIQVVHSAPEGDGMYRNISEGQKKQETVIQLCKMADQVITIGTKLAEAYKRYLRPSKQGGNVFDLTPSIFSEFLEKEQAVEERQTFYVLLIGSGDSCEDFTVKGYDIAAKAIAELKDESYKLRFVCAPGGKGDEVAEKLLHHGISRNQLLVRSFNDSREVLANLFCEVDLAIMPSRTDGFGIRALEALSAGLPVLVSSNSGLGEALKKVSLGSQCVVDSGDPKDWAREIKRVRQKEREVRLSESRSLRKKYLKKYSWEEPCRRLVNRMYELAFGSLESGTIFPIRDKRPTPIVVADQPAKRLREELIHSTQHELQGAEGPSVSHLPQSSMECEQFSLPRVFQSKPIDQRSFTQSQNRYPSSEHCENPFAGASSTYCGGPEHQRSHPQGSDHCLVEEHLRDEYIRRSNVKPLLWDSDIQLPIDDVYTRLQIKWRRKAYFQLTEKEVHMHEIFKPAKEGGNGARMVLVEGNPGIGKTTFCLKIARDWAKKLVPREFHSPVFQLLFLLKCCDIHKDTKDIVQAIEEQLLNDDMKNREDFLEYIRDSNNQDKILLILDGLDELPEASENVVVKLFRRKIFSRSFILATSREEKGIDVRRRYDFDTLLQIKGFTSEDATDYIRKHFKSVDPQNLSKGERLIKAVKENTYLDALKNNPLNLLLLCVVFEDFDGKLPSNRTKLYQIIFRCLLRRYCSRNGLDVHRNADEALENQFKESILVLGELAWKCLLEDRRSFLEEELGKLEHSWTHVRRFPVIKLGLVFMEASSRPSQESRHQCHFLHKTFQEFLAAFYLANELFTNQPNLTLGKKDVCEKYRQVFFFVAGILGMEGTVFFKQIGTILRADWNWCDPVGDCKFLLDLLEESGAADHFGKVVCPLIPVPTDFKVGQRERSCLRLIRYAYEGAMLEGDSTPVQLTTLSLCNVQSLNRDDVHNFHRILKNSQTLTELVIYKIENMSHDIADLFAESLSSSTSLRKVTLKLLDVSIERCTYNAIALLSTLKLKLKLKCVALEFFCILNNTVAKAVKALFKTWLRSLALIVHGDLDDCLVTSVSEGLAEETGLESLSLVIHGKLSNPGIIALQKGVLRNRTLHSLELQVYGEIPEAWMTAVATILAAKKSWESLLIHPNVCGKIEREGSLLPHPILGDAPLEKSLTVNVCGELSVDSLKALGGFFTKSSPLSGLQLNVRGKLSNDVVDYLVDYFLTNISLPSHSIIDICGEITSHGETVLQRLVQGSPEQSISVHLNGISRDRYLSGFDTLANFSPPSASFLADGKTATYDEVIALLSCASSTTFNLTVNNHAGMPGEWARGVARCLPFSRSLTTFILTLNNHTDEGANWAHYMSQGLRNCASLTTFSLTLNNLTDERESWASFMSQGLPNCASLTTFSLTLNNLADEGENWACYMSQGLPKCASLTTFSLTLNNLTDEGPHWAYSMSKGLPKCASLTTFSLTLNNLTDEGPNWAYYMSQGLPKCASLTTFSLTLNNLIDERESWASFMSQGLPKCASLTTFSLTLNNLTDEGTNWAYHMSQDLPKCASLTTFSLTLNNLSDVRGKWTNYMSKGLPKCASLTTFSLTLNNLTDEGENWAYHMSQGLPKCASLTTFCLTVNDHADMIGNWVRGLSNGLEKNRSLTTIRVAFSLYGARRIR